MGVMKDIINYRFSIRARTTVGGITAFGYDVKMDVPPLPVPGEYDFA